MGSFFRLVKPRTYPIIHGMEEVPHMRKVEVALNFEVGGGGFKKINKLTGWIGELYGGAGFGSVENDYGSGDHSKVRISKLFLQPAIGYRSTSFEFAFVPKVSFINWKVKEMMINPQNNSSAYNEVAAVGVKQNFAAFEPAFIIRGGGKNFKLQTALSFSARNSSSPYSQGLTETLNLSIGISINLDPTGK
jgi:hypothetical protein